MLNHCSIILRGNFNPAIFQPEWFNRFKILPIQEIQWAEGEKPKTKEVPFADGKFIISEVPKMMVLHNRAEIHFISFDLKVLPTKFECLTQKRENFSSVKNLVVDTFRLLPHTPISAAGINFAGDSEFDKNAGLLLKDLFSNKELQFKENFGDNYKIGGVLYSITDDLRLTLRLEESTKLQNGIYYNFNFHREINTKAAEQAIEAITLNFDNDIKKTIQIIQNILGKPRKSWPI
ncbi:MAG: hypothetical protein FJ135_11005 [Deltaproteobacteria bacterium]|nr:hypothetical protein [Deltaproteobacteria bacterium]